MRADEIMTRLVVTVHADTSVQQAAALLTERGISSLPVLDEDDHVIGIVSEIDLLRNRMPHDPRSHMRTESDERKDPARLVGDVMTATVVCMPPFADAADLVELMLDNNVRAVPIVDGVHLVGIVGRRDLLSTLLRNDAVIRNEVALRLNEYAGDSESDRWSVAVEDGVVTVRGAFDDERQRDVVTVLARTVPGVVRVHLHHRPLL
jgi:CBS-domain-containing membrane protein